MCRFGRAYSGRLRRKAPAWFTLMEGRNTRAVEVRNAHVVLKTTPHSGRIGGHGYPETLQQPWITDAGKLEQLRRVDGAAAEEHFAPCTYLMLSARTLVLHTA